MNITMHLKLGILLLAFFLLLASSCKGKSSLDIALDSSGNNRNELQKILNHYDKKPADSLKYKAALFLIENMPYYSYYPPISKFNDVFDSIKKYPRDNHLFKDVFKNMLDSVSKLSSINNTHSLKDVQNLDSQFLIKNIELAFQAWSRVPGNKRASFEDFCNYILPYRSTNEPIERGSREKLFNKYSWVYEYLDKGENLKFIADSILSNVKFKNFPGITEFYPYPLSIGQMEKSKIGLCDDGVNYFVNVFRALGIVCAKDMITHWGNHHSSGHSWIYLKLGEEEYSTNIQGDNNVKIKFKKESIPKVFRTSFAYKNIGNRYPLVTDVTHTYVQTMDFNIENIYRVPISEPVICVFDKQREWLPVENGKSNIDSEVIYKNMGVNVLYLAASIEDNGIVPINFPFYVDLNKQIHFYRPSSIQIKDSIRITRKYGLSTPRNKSKTNWLKSFNGSFFEGSNYPDFRTPTKLYQISNLTSTQINQVKFNVVRKFRYVRFNSNGKEPWLAKLAFYDGDKVLLKGNTIKENMFDLIWENGAFDNDPLTFSGGKDFKLGLGFPEPKNIGHVEFQARNDDNHINPGEEYELFYWDKQWESLGVQIAKDTVLHYAVPKNALLWLKNHIKGREEHVFTADVNQRQKWLGFDNY